MYTTVTAGLLDCSSLSSPLTAGNLLKTTFFGGFPRRKKAFLWGGTYLENMKRQKKNVVEKKIVDEYTAVKSSGSRLKNIVFAEKQKKCYSRPRGHRARQQGDPRGSELRPTRVWRLFYVVAEGQPRSFLIFLEISA